LFDFSQRKQLLKEGISYRYILFQLMRRAAGTVDHGINDGRKFLEILVDYCYHQLVFIGEVVVKSRLRHTYVVRNFVHGRFGDTEMGKPFSGGLDNRRKPGIFTHSHPNNSEPTAKVKT